MFSSTTMTPSTGRVSSIGEQSLAGDPSIFCTQEPNDWSDILHVCKTFAQLTALLKGNRIVTLLRPLLRVEERCQKQKSGELLCLDRSFPESWTQLTCARETWSNGMDTDLLSLELFDDAFGEVLDRQLGSHIRGLLPSEGGKQSSQNRDDLAALKDTGRLLPAA